MLDLKLAGVVVGEANQAAPGLEQLLIDLFSSSVFRQTKIEWGANLKYKIYLSALKIIYQMKNVKLKGKMVLWLLPILSNKILLLQLASIGENGTRSPRYVSSEKERNLLVKMKLNI